MQKQRLWCVKLRALACSLTAIPQSNKVSYAQAGIKASMFFFNLLRYSHGPLSDHKFSSTQQALKQPREAICLWVTNLMITPGFQQADQFYSLLFGSKVLPSHSKKQCHFFFCKIAPCSNCGLRTSNSHPILCVCGFFYLNLCVEM